MSTIGTLENPYTVAPDGWLEHGFNSDSYVVCKCAKCGLVAYCTVIFDYYADGAGKPLTCERCATGVPWTNEGVKEFQDAVMADEQNPLAKPPTGRNSHE